MQRLFPNRAARLSVDAPYATLDLPDGPSDRPYVIANMVSTVDGKIALDGRSRGIGSRTDRRMMRLIRANVDALLVGAETLRSEIVDPRVPTDLAAARSERGEPAQPLAVAVSGSLDLDPQARFFANGPERSVILTTMRAAGAHGSEFDGVATLLTTDAGAADGEVDLAAALALLRRDWGVRRLLCEGGPSLNQRLLDLGLLDELFWTIAPKLAGGNGASLLTSDQPAERIRATLQLVSLYEHDGALFARYRVLRSAP